MKKQRQLTFAILKDINYIYFTVYSTNTSNTFKHLMFNTRLRKPNLIVKLLQYITNIYLNRTNCIPA